ncbi:OLC1v1036638C1 [Oldenlandia corymbosa var. corymbosa]|uniref:OLC1v1036638C1 n=1 Tax=Oldenlandia corymbosa var. corymbosa TaxID=529605 RepID=A0AAV1CYH7_OLDCO|nr:OLC1v1036638C1 [Oldenlandia corymbosa var. corymbosa]
MNFGVIDTGFGIRRRMALDYDGNLRIHSFNNSNGLCDWNKGCKPTFNLSHLIYQPVKFVKISEVDYNGFDTIFNKSISLEACKELCRKDPNCLAINYKSMETGYCYTKSAMYNGYYHPQAAEAMFLKVPQNLSIQEPLQLDGFHAICDTDPREILK